MAEKTIGKIFESMDKDIKNSVYLFCGTSAYDKDYLSSAINLLRNFDLLKKDEKEAIIYLLERRLIDLQEENNGQKDRHS